MPVTAPSQINIYVFKEFYMRSFCEESVYSQFEQRLKEVKGSFTGNKK